MSQVNTATTTPTFRAVFNDGTYGVTIGVHTVLIAKQDGAAIHIPRGHAFFDRVCEATDRRTVEDLHNELVAAIA